MGLTRYEAEVTVFDESGLYKLEQHSVYLAAEVEAVLKDFQMLKDAASDVVHANNMTEAKQAVKFLNTVLVSNLKGTT